MPFQKVEYEFPEDDSVDSTDIEVESSDAVEIDLSGKKTADDYADTSSKPEVETAEAEEDIEVEVVDDTPKADRNRKPSEPPADVTDEELENYSDKVRKRIQHFSKGYHDERRAKEAAERERTELEKLTQRLVDENKELKGTVNKNQELLLEQAKKNTEAELAAAKKAYAEAYEAGDTERVVDAQEALTNAKIRSDKLDNFEVEPLQEEETSVQVTPEPLDERAAKWVQDNPWFVQDIGMRQVALTVHDRLIKSGVSPQSDEYYETIDARMRKVFPEEFNDSVEEVFEEERPKRQSNVVAPATRSTGPRKVTLNATQMALTKRLGITPQEYAKQMAALERGN
jgi:hypothetical protein